MSTDLSELHDDLRAVARDLLARSGPTVGDDGTANEVDWGLVVQSGWSGLEVSEALDGSGATFAEVGVILEELGRAGAASPFLGTVVLGVGALERVEPGEGRDRLLRGIADGGARVGVALVDGARDEVAPPPPFRLEQTADGLRLHGRADFVPDAPEASDLLLLAVGPARRPVFVPVASASPGIVVVEQPVLDPTRRFASVSADGVAVEDDAVMELTGDAEGAASHLFDRAALAVAHDALGVSRAMLDATVDYVKDRRQFDRPIGSFQAVKHACADMLVQVVVVEELVRSATEALVSGRPDTGVPVSMAKAHSSDAAVQIAGKAMQLHGGIGYTWESGIHLFLKRAALDRSLFGSPAAHRRRVGARHTVSTS